MRILGLFRHGHVTNIDPSTKKPLSERELTPIGKQQIVDLAFRLRDHFPDKSFQLLHGSSRRLKQCRGVSMAHLFPSDNDITEVTELNEEMSETPFNAGLLPHLNPEHDIAACFASAPNISNLFLDIAPDTVKPHFPIKTGSGYVLYFERAKSWQNIGPQTYSGIEFFDQNPPSPED